MNHRERLEACVEGIIPDRVPVSLWRHFPGDDQDPYQLAKSTIEFQRNYDFDFVKVTPASSFCVKDWGAKDEWKGATEGTRDYIHFPIQHAEDWLTLRPLDPRQGWLGKQLECLRIIREEIPPEVPIIQTIFSPLSQAKNLASRSSSLIWVRTNPQEVMYGLKVITETTLRFIDEVKKIGIDGIFYAVQHAQYGLLNESEYLQFGKPFDLEILEQIQPFWLNMLHIHGENIMFQLFQDYPVQIINWHDRETYPSLAEAQKLIKGVVCGGLSREKKMVFGKPDDIYDEARDAIAATEGRRLILGTGCVVPIIAPLGNIRAARECVEKIPLQ
ncbi:MAG: uroporphyrinogen decarboxylase family protein [Anaerolineales bacterium]